MSIFIGSTRITNPQTVALLTQVATHPNAYGLDSVQQDHGNYRFTPEQVERFLNPNNPSGNRVDLQDCAQRLAEINGASSSQTPEATFRQQFAQLATQYRRIHPSSPLQVSDEVADTRFFLPLYMAVGRAPSGGVALGGMYTRIAMARTGLCCGSTPLRSGDFCRDLSLAHPASLPRGVHGTATISIDHYEIIRGGAMTTIAANATGVLDDARPCNPTTSQGHNATFVIMRRFSIPIAPESNR